MSLFTSKLIRTDVTSVKIVDDYVFSGIGGKLHIFSRHTNNLLKQVTVFEGEKIMGFDLNHKLKLLMVFGGTHLTLLSFTELYEDFLFKKTVNLNDWILCAKWIESENKIGVVTMKNKYLILSPDLQTETEVICDEKCMLYSAFICNDSIEDIFILSGTVFSEVLVWKPTKSNQNVKKLTGHKGVIFSLDYNPTNQLICSCSDDRSAILWAIENPELKITKQTQVFGHLSRVFRCKILTDFFVTGGEDSFVILWSFDGQIIRKIDAHQGSTIWALDCSEKANCLAVGAANSGLTLYSIKIDINEIILKLPNKEIPKSVQFLVENNLVCVSDRASLYFFDKLTEKWNLIGEHSEMKNYCVMQVSKCRRLVALAGIQGQIYLYKFKSSGLHSFIAYQSPQKTRIYSFHWLTCKSFIICQQFGVLTVFLIEDNSVIPFSTHLVPPSKERWSTACCMISKKHFVIGDRKGHLYVFELGKTDPIQVLKRAHSHLGVTNLDLQEDKLISLGRNSIVKTFAVNNNILELIITDKVPYSWLAKMDKNLLLAFSGNNFVIWNYKSRNCLFERDCGGGHRSWDFDRYAEKTSFVFVKDKEIHCISTSNRSLHPVELIEGLHTNEINALKLFGWENDSYVVSGGEDTTLQSNVILKKEFTELKKMSNLKIHLSNIRCLEAISWKNNKYLFSGGGRAQIIWWKHSLNCDKSIKNITNSEMFSYHEELQSEDSEMRIMDLQNFTKNDDLYLFAACSNGCIKMFFIDEENRTIVLLKNIFYSQKCIMKVTCVKFGDDYPILVTMATDGCLVFWNTNDFFAENYNAQPLACLKSHQSGINSYSHKILDKNKNLLLFLTGGDDNCISLDLIEFNKEKNTINLTSSFKDVSTHCAQITGTLLLREHFLTCSIDQRICIFDWKIKDNEIICQNVAKYNTAIADVQGLDHYKDKIVVFGNGFEYIQLPDFVIS